MSILEFPNKHDNGREVLISMPDGDIVIRCSDPISIGDAIYLLERARFRVIAHVEGLDRALLLGEISNDAE